MAQSIPRVGEPSRSDSGPVSGGEDRKMDEITACADPATDTETPAISGSSGSYGPDSEITFLYLTFRRPLPSTNIGLAPNSSSPPLSPLPPPPDMSLYVDPLLWPKHRKNLMLVLSCVATFLTAYTAGSYSPPTPLIRTELGNPSEVGVRAGITTFCAGFALAPMVLAPFSEINGRYPVFVVSGTIFAIFHMVCGFMENLAGMLVARFLLGVGGSVFSSMVGGVIADLWEKADRNTPMALFSGAVMAGTGAGPLVGAVITQRLATSGQGASAAWKWVFWHQAIAAGVLMVSLVCLFKESRGSVVLSRKARALNKWYEELEKAGYYGVWIEDDGDTVQEKQPASSEQNVSVPDEEKKQTSSRESRRNSSVSGLRLLRVRWLVKEDEERSSIGKMISISVYRPFFLLCTEPVVFFFSLWVSFAWTVLYITFGSIPLVFSRQYGWNLEQAGYVFVAMILGSFLATGLGIWQEQVLHHPAWQSRPHPPPADDLPRIADTVLRSSLTSRFWSFARRRFPADSPESRLYFTCISSTLLPISLFMFGFTARPDVHWIFPAIAIALATIGIFTIYLAVFNYFADTYNRYASSVIAAQSFCRNVMGGAFPLVTTALFQNLGEARAGVILGAVATLLTAVPWVLVFFGERIRARSPFATVLEKLE